MLFYPGSERASAVPADAGRATTLADPWPGIGPKHDESFLFPNHRDLQRTAHGAQQVCRAVWIDSKATHDPGPPWPAFGRRD